MNIIKEYRHKNGDIIVGEFQSIGTTVFVEWYVKGDNRKVESSPDQFFEYMNESGYVDTGVFIVK